MKLKQRTSARRSKVETGDLHGKNVGTNSMVSLTYREGERRRERKSREGDSRKKKKKKKKKYIRIIPIERARIIT